MHKYYCDRCKKEFKLDKTDEDLIYKNCNASVNIMKRNSLVDDEVDSGRRDWEYEWVDLCPECHQEFNKIAYMFMNRESIFVPFKEEYKEEADGK